MSDYISREETIKAIKSQSPDAHYLSCYVAILEKAPASDVRVNTKGQWIEGEYGITRCSECGYILDANNDITPFCPDCGANMEPDLEEETEEKQSLLGRRISAMLEKKGITQRELAEMVGVTEVSMSRYIKGDRVPKASVVENIARALDTTVYYLVGTEYYLVGFGSEEKRADKLARHKAICDGIHDLYERKNHDYGDSFGQSFRDHGILAGVIRIEDKFNRLRTLTGGSEQKVKDESIRDTLRDMANYAIMTLLEMEGE